MARFSLRLGLGLVTVFALALIGYVLFRPRTLPGAAVVDAALPPSSAISSQSAPGEWAMEGYDPARTRALPNGITLPVNRQREFHIANDQGIGSPVAVAQNVMLVEADHFLKAIDMRSGKERWSFPELGRYISPAIAGQTALIRAESGNKGQIFALDLLSGKQLWAFTPRRLSSEGSSYWGGHLTSPVVADGVVFIGAGRELYALDLASGAVRWEFSAVDFIGSSATVAEGRVFIADVKNFYAVDQRTGKLAWKAPTAFSIYFAPVVAGRTVVVTNGESLMALNTADGAKQWDVAFPNESLLPAAVHGSRVLVKSAATLRALDLASGKEIWRFDHPAFISFPAVAGDQLFAVTGSGVDTGLTILDAVTGRHVAQHALETLSNAAPVIAGQTLYVRTTDGRVLGLFN